MGKMHHEGEKTLRRTIPMRKAVKAFVTLVIILTVLSTIFLIGRYGWKLWGFRTTEYPDPVPSPAENPTTLEAYATIIGEYYTAFSEGWDAAQVMEAGLNYMVADSHHGNPLAEIGYTVTDLDGDGTDELAIGSMAEDEFFGKIIFSLYTLDENGVPMLVFDSTERNRYYYAGGICFANLGSSGWNESFTTTLKLEDKEMIDMTYTTDPADYVQMNITPFSEWVK